MRTAASHRAMGITMAVTHPAICVTVRRSSVRVAAPAVTVARPREGRHGEGERRCSGDEDELCHFLTFLSALNDEVENLEWIVPT